MKGKSTRLLFVALALILTGNIGATLIQTAGGTIDVIGLKIPTENGQWVTADLFKPKSATAENPAPMVVVCPGFQRTKETQISNSIELARRGIVALTIDPYWQGDSSVTLSSRTATDEGYGIIPIIKYICDTNVFNYVDKSRIGATGHSAGGNAALRAAAYFGKEKIALLEKAAEVDSEDGELISPGELAAAEVANRVSAAFVSGYVLTFTNAVLKTVDTNLGMGYALYDEGAFRNENKNGDMRTAPESLRVVNMIFPKGEKLSEIEIGRFYGDKDKGTLRVVYNEKTIHPIQPYIPAAVSTILEFFTTCFDLQPALTSNNQIWFFKELMNFLALIGGFLFIIPFASLLLRTPAFASLVKPIPTAIPGPKTPKDKIIFCGIFTFSALVACIAYVPMAKATSIFFPKATGSDMTWWFPGRMINAVLLWAVLNGTLGLIIFFLNYRFHGKQRGITPAMWGLEITRKDLAKTFALAVSVFGSFYTLLFISYHLFHTDFRFLVLAAHPFNLRWLLIALMYFPLFFIFYFSNSLRVNGSMRLEGQKRWKSLLLCGFANSTGLILIMIIQYVCFGTTGTIFWTDQWLYINMLQSIIPMMFILPYFNRFFFELTGRVYLGPMVTVMIFIMMSLCSGVAYTPYFGF
ncbi:MAG: alpha/beta hydrolase [Treponema sp.]|jgi:hypothetical protein|nr:alpha/beta hydrolase [Treponema sp.]